MVKWIRNPDSIRIFFFVSGRPNLRRKVRELMSAHKILEIP